MSQEGLQPPDATHPSTHTGPSLIVSLDSLYGRGPKSSRQAIALQGQQKNRPAHHQSQRPSFQPVRHRSSHLEQSNSGLLSLRLTSLCAPHSHMPNSPRLPTRGASRPMYVWKSSAHTQHGYSLEKSLTKLNRSDCCPREGFSGYVAAIECSSVHELRPSTSTSGGQSAGGPDGADVAAAAAVADPDPDPDPAVAADLAGPVVGAAAAVVLPLLVLLSSCLTHALACAVQAVKDVQLRQLCAHPRCISLGVRSDRCRRKGATGPGAIGIFTHGLPSLPSTTPGGYFLGCSAAEPATAVGTSASLASSAIANATATATARGDSVRTLVHRAGPYQVTRRARIPAPKRVK
ncbi:hypothetical protein PCL_11180 [Purpureocillium lilacinum]|uniref:Uncharacterized protein n=1 Tax=Purpureocillium lilacinum TaxID=33203 RepID=A0A2U3EDG6_PURLI|nr:hypothetical protein PCL_11180 [Purpureocillium lilacinum]